MEFKSSKYRSSINSYVLIDDAINGGGCAYITNTLNVYDFQFVKEDLYVYTERKYVDENGNEGTITKNKYTFKKQDTGYYMYAVEKLN